MTAPPSPAFPPAGPAMPTQPPDPAQPATPPALPPNVLVVALRAHRGNTPGGSPSHLPAVPLLRPFAIGEGAVLEAVAADGTTVLTVLRALLRAGGPRVGIGCGSPRPRGAAASGPRPPAHAAARVALGAAGRAHQGVALRASRRAAAPPPSPRAVDDAETCLWLLADIWRRRTPEGWAVADLMDAGLTGRACAQRLDISPSAVSQRAAAARYVESRRAADLAARLLDGLLAP